jgi:hypothetical protein
MSSESFIYVVVKHEGAYSCQDWCIKGVYTNLHDSHVAGWLLLVDECLLEHKLKFYKNRRGEFATAIGMSEYHIEEWYPSTSTKGKIWYIGFDNKKRHYKNYIDEFIKNTQVLNKNCEEVLREWKIDLNNKKIPKILSEMILLDSESHDINL